MRVVVDTNVLVSAMISAEGASREVIRACLIGTHGPLMRNALLAEFEDVVSRPEILRSAPIAEGDRRDLLDAFLAVCDWVPIYFLWRPNLTDEADNYLVELALSGGAECIVTHNARDFAASELLFPDLAILSPRQFLTIGGQ